MAPHDRSSTAGTHADVWVGAALLAFCGLVYWSTTTFREVPAMLSQNVPPTFFPRLVLVVIAALSLLLVAAGLRKEREPRERLPAPVFVTAGILTAAVFVVTWLGMLVTVALVSIVLPIFWGERRPLRIAALAIGLPLVLYGLFTLALGMRFPAGTLW